QRRSRPRLRAAQARVDDRAERNERRLRDSAGAPKRMVTLVRAPNPSVMTLQGTNSYVIDCGDATALVIDPGPAIDGHLRALVDVAQSKRLTICAIALTHGHPDHASGARQLATMTHAPLYAHPKSTIPHD